MIDGSAGVGLHLGDLVRVLCPELFLSHGNSSFIAGDFRLVFICLNRGGGLGCDRGNVVRRKHAGGKVHLPPVHEQAAPVRAGGDAGRLRVLDQFVRKALVDGLAACHIGRVCHHVGDHRG